MLPEPHESVPTVPLTQLCPELPSQYNYEAAIDAALDGLTWYNIAQALGCSRKTLYRLRERYVTFNQTLIQARASANEYLADDLRTIVEDHPELHDKPQVLKQMFESGKWYLACADPRKYGDRMNIEVTERVDLKGAMDKAKERVITVLASQPQADVLGQTTSNSSSEAIDK